MSSEMTHSAPQLLVESASNTISMPCCKGYCSSKASHGVESGTWYFEVQIIKGDVRVGWGQALAEIQAPIGYDEYGYGFSNKNSKIFHCSRGYPVQIENEASVIGCLLCIPDIELEESNDTISAIKQKYPPLNFLTTYNVKQDILQNGSIQFYADGQPISCGRFENIYRAKYFPTVSIFGDAKVVVRFSESQFTYPIPEGALPFEKVSNIALHEKQ
jgi:Set1/Ash2 histone methyltransferase complex subunit ASH2